MQAEATTVAWGLLISSRWLWQALRGAKSVSFRKGVEVDKPSALFINGVFEDNLAGIEENQGSNPGKPYYLQPYSTRKIELLAKSNPTPGNPITLYLSLTTSLNSISYRAKIVGWQDKRKLEKGSAALALLNQHIKDFQSSEVEIYLEASPGKPCVNLISVIDVERLDPPFSVSRLIKTSDGKPLKTTRTTAGGWSVVYDSGTPIEKGVVEAELQAEVAKSLNDDDTARQQRLATATKKPQVIQVVSRAFRRNADVIAVVSKRANGICEECHSPAPFHRASNDTPYLEVHHRIMLSAGGEDTVANALALCPNCHRKLHFGKSDTPSEA